MLRVLTYHRIADPDATPHLDPSIVSARPEVFRKQMLHVRRHYHPVSFDQVLEAFRDGVRLPPRAVHVTVDDAYRDFAEHAWPILRELEIPVTLFVPTAYPGRPERALWWDRLHSATSRESSPDAWRRAIHTARAAVQTAPPREVDDLGQLRTLLKSLPHDDAERFVDCTCAAIGQDAVAPPRRSTVLSWGELRALQQEGVSFGAHTQCHAALTRVDADRIRKEIRGSLEDLDRELGAAPRAIAYPYGIYDRRVSRIAEEEGCALGFTCDDGLNHPGETNPFELRRTNITPRTSSLVFPVRMLPWFAEVDRWRHRSHRELVTR